ncbi:MAG: NHL repeat-containing protein, partial [Candidatus Hodarchaeota archaeon]
MRILNIKVALVFLNFFLNYSIKAQPVEIHNTLKEINSCVGRISLKLIWELGGEVIEDEEQAFYIPVDIAIDRKGYIYVLDQGNNRIQLFNSNRKYIKTIGRAGKGPGEFAEPRDFAFYCNNSLIISDFSNRRIQIIDSTGQYIGGFKLDRFVGEIVTNAKNEIIMVNTQMISASSNALFCVYNDKGKLIRSIGENKYSYPRQRILEGIYFDLDSQDNIYVSYYVHPQIEIYGSSGKLISKVIYEVPFKVSEPESH